MIFCLQTNDIGLLHEIKQILSKTFEMKELGQAYLASKCIETGLVV